MKSAKLLISIATMSLFAVWVAGCTCPSQCQKAPECEPSSGWATQVQCTYLTGTSPYCRDDSDPINQENMNKEVIVFGDSIAAGYNCLEQNGTKKCGFVSELETLLGQEIANFGLTTFMAKQEVEGGWSLPVEMGGGTCTVSGPTPFWRSHEALEKNPDASLVFVHIGTNDVFNYAFSHLSDFPKPPTCTLSSAFLSALDTIVSHVRAIVEEFQVLGIPKIVVGSFPPVEENSYDWCTFASPLCGNCYLCVNEVFEIFSNKLALMVQSMGGPGAGVSFADHFHGIVVPSPYNGCNLHCTTVHLNCLGYEQMAQIWASAVP